MEKKRKKKSKTTTRTVKIFSQKTARTEKVIKHIKKHLGIYLSLLSLALGIVVLLNYFHDRKLSTLTGMLSNSGSAKIKYLAIGTAVRFKVDTPEGILFRDGGQPLITLNLRDGKLLISAIIRDLTGKIIAELVNNEWQVNRNNMFDRNYNDKAIEVRDNVGNVVLQAAHFGDTIFFAGIFHCNSGKTGILHPIKKGDAAIELIPPGEESDYQIEPLFKYPSNRYFGLSPRLEVLEKEILQSNFTEYTFKTNLDICVGAK
jgi:hypothetical protein